MLEFVGVGDLHLDGKLKKYLPNLNSLIWAEVTRVLSYAKRNGIKLVVFYGDICETPHMSHEAQRLLLNFLLENTDFKFVFLLGNHDTENSETHSMQLFADMIAGGMLDHVTIIEKPRTLFKKSGTPLRLLPWPSLDTDEDCMNVIHNEVNGSVWDGGRAVSSSHTVPKKHVCVAGHLHTPQTVGGVHFSGTLYQTSFGERSEKYFHHVTWIDSDAKKIIKKVPHKAAFELVNLVVEAEKDLDQIKRDPNVLYKVFIQSDVTLDAGTFDGYDNVVKINPFKTKSELKAMMTEELRLDEDFELASVLSLETNLKSWLGTAKIDDDLKRRAYKKFKQLALVAKGS